MNMKGKYLFCPGIFLAAAIMGASGCSARKLLPFDDKLVSSVDDETKKEKAYMVVTPTPTTVPEPTATPTPTPGALQPLIDEADKFAVQYDYDGAIRFLESQPQYSSSEELQNAAEKYQANSLV